MGVVMTSPPEQDAISSSVRPGLAYASRRNDPGTALIELRDVHVDFSLEKSILRKGGELLRAVDGVSLSIDRGQTLGLVGGTGSGKSTLAGVLMGMVEPTAGSVRIDGEEQTGLTAKQRRHQRNRVQVVMQDPYSSLDPRMRVGQIIAEPLLVAQSMSRAQIRERVAELLELVGLSPAKAALYPHEFSGGQRQRIAISRALASDPEVIVLDEPTSALDVSVRAQILMLLKDIQARFGVTYLVISHDLMSVAFLASTVAVMYQGRIVELGPMQRIYAAPQHPYTVLLLASAPDARGSFLDAIDAGLVPPRDNQADAPPPGGCAYFANCALRPLIGSPRCAEEDPQLTTVGVGHEAACHHSDKIPDLPR